MSALPVPAQSRAQNESDIARSAAVYTSSLLSIRDLLFVDGRPLRWPVAALRYVLCDYFNYEMDIIRMSSKASTLCQIPLPIRCQLHDIPLPADMLNYF
jgi:hypothetical protein